MYDIIVVGAGPAGMTAALYALRANKKVLVFEAKSPGGQIINASKVENYPAIKSISGVEYSTNLYNQIIDLGAEFKFETVIRVDEDKTVHTDKGDYKAKAVIIATGSENRKLGCAGEKENIGRGVSYCATCDGNFFKGKNVSVVGGGNTALEDAIYLSNLAAKVYVIHRRSEFRGENIYFDELKNKNNVEFIYNTVVTKINSDNKVNSIDIKNSEGEEKNIEVNGVFIAIGQQPKNDIFTNILDIDEKGYIISEDGVHTKTKGIYVAGDARVKNLRQLTSAVSDGSIAANIAMKEMED